MQRISLSACWRKPGQQHPSLAAALPQGGGGGGSGTWRPNRRKPQPGPGTPWSLLLALLALGVSSCKGAPMASHVLQGEKVWNKIDDVCSAYLARDALLQSTNGLKDLCFMVLEFLQKDQPSTWPPLLQHVPQLHERIKRYKVDDELRIPGGVQSRGYFMFRPRNGRRSATFY